MSEALSMLRTLLDPRERRRRMERLRDAGLIETIPTGWQVLVGTMRMLAEYAVPLGDAEFRARHGRFLAGQLARYARRPWALLNLTGLYGSEDAIARHLTGLLHHDAAYDVELLHMFPGALARLCDECARLAETDAPLVNVHGAPARAPDYHARLAQAVGRYIRDPSSQDIFAIFGAPEGEIPDDPLAARYGTPSRFLRWCTTLPTSPWNGAPRAEAFA